MNEFFPFVIAEVPLLPVYMDTRELDGKFHQCPCVYLDRNKTQDQLKILYIEMHQLYLTKQTPQFSCTVSVTVLSPDGHMDDHKLQVASVVQALQK